MKRKLHILMLTKYFDRNQARGGSEQSAHHLAHSLAKRGHKITFGFSLRCRPDIIHIHSPSFLPMAIAISKLFNIPTVLTVRDYSLICPLGFCLWNKPTGCSLVEFLTDDIPTYAKFYPSHILSPLLHLGVRLRSKIWRFLAHQVDQIVCISQAQRKIFAANGFRHLPVIYNTTDFTHTVPPKRLNQIIFVGRLTPGKGADLLLPLAKKYQIVVAGSGFLAPKLRQSSITLMGQVSYSRILKLYRQVKLAIFPSRWPEPFGRGALEAIAAGTPVVTSNKGGLPEIVQNKYGLSVEPTPAKLAQAIDYVITHHRHFATAIAQDRPKLIYKFHTQPVNQYETLYYRCLA